MTNALPALARAAALALLILAACSAPQERTPGIVHAPPTEPVVVEPAPVLSSEVFAEPVAANARRDEELIERAPSLTPEGSDGILDIHFGSGASDLTHEARASLDGFSSLLLSGDGDFHIGIHGHADSVGDEEANRLLSEYRAEVVKTYLRSRHGVPEDRMSILALGETAPVTDDPTDDGLRRNRRVVVVLLMTQ